MICPTLEKWSTDVLDFQWYQHDQCWVFVIVLRISPHTCMHPGTYEPVIEGPSWSWSNGSWIYNYLYNQCLSPVKLWVRIQHRRCVLDTILCDKVCQWLVTGRWFSLVSSTNKTDFHDIAQILLKVALITITLTPNPVYILDHMNRLHVIELHLIVKSFCPSTLHC